MLNRKLILLMACCLFRVSWADSAVCNNPAAAIETKKMQSSIVDLLQAKKYAELNSYFDKLSQQYEQQQIDARQFLAGYRAFSRIDSIADPKEMLLDGESWQKTTGRYHATLALAFMHQALGLKARGGKFISETPSGQLDAATAEFKIEMDLIKEALKLNSKSMPAKYLELELAIRDSSFGNPVKLYQGMGESAWQNGEIQMLMMMLLDARWSRATKVQRTGWIDEAAKRGLRNDYIQLMRATAMQSDIFELRQANNDFTVEYSNADPTVINKVLNENLLKLSQERQKICPSPQNISDVIKYKMRLKQFAAISENTKQLLEYDPNDRDALNQQGFSYRHQNKLPEAFASYSRSANLGHIASKYRVGESYLNGWGVPADKSKAIQWFEMAAAGGSQPAKIMLEKLK